MPKAMEVRNTPLRALWQPCAEVVSKRPHKRNAQRQGIIPPML